MKLPTTTCWICGQVMMKAPFEGPDSWLDPDEISIRDARRILGDDFIMVIDPEEDENLKPYTYHYLKRMDSKCEGYLPHRITCENGEFWKELRIIKSEKYDQVVVRLRGRAPDVGVLK